jgi:hypothetical protein
LRAGMGTEGLESAGGKKRHGQMRILTEVRAIRRPFAARGQPMGHKKCPGAFWASGTNGSKGGHIRGKRFVPPDFKSIG